MCRSLHCRCCRLCYYSYYYYCYCYYYYNDRCYTPPPPSGPPGRSWLVLDDPARRVGIMRLSYLQEESVHKDLDHT